MKVKRSNGVPGRSLKPNQQISIRDIVKRAEPEALKSTGLESQRNGTSKLTAAEIDRIIKVTRTQQKKR